MVDFLHRERRDGCAPDRRRKPGFPRLFFGQRRRRSTGRRFPESPGYVDVYDFRSWAIALSILFLSVIDAFLTGLQVSCGSVIEANPLMRLILVRGGIPHFFGAKIAMTALPLALLIMHKEWSLARFAARSCLWAYILLSFYHIYLVGTVACHEATF